MARDPAIPAGTAHTCTTATASRPHLTSAGSADPANRLGHELRTPLTSIRGYAEALADEAGPQLSAEHRRWLAAILRGVERMQGAVELVEDELRSPAA